MQTTYEVTPNEPNKYVCHVGWDKAHESYFIYVARRLKTFQGQVVRDPDSFNRDGHTVLWIGTTHKEITSVEEVAKLLSPFATLPEAMCQPLRDMKLQHTDERRAAASSNRRRPTK